MQESRIVGEMGLTIDGGRGLTTEPTQGNISARLFNDVVQNRPTSFAFCGCLRCSFPVIGLNMNVHSEGAERYEVDQVQYH